MNSYFRALFAYFDETRCRWKSEKDSCDNDVTESHITFSGETDSGIDSVVDDENDSEIDINLVDQASSGGLTGSTDTLEVETTNINTEPTNDATDKPFYQNLECEPLDKTWMCSSGSKNHSLCIKFCTEGLDFVHIIYM